MKKIKEFLIKTHLINLLAIFYYAFRVCKVKKNKIFCQNFTSGKGVGDSPKYIVEYLLKNNPGEYDIVWATKKDIHRDYQDDIRYVDIYSIKYFYEMVTAKFWITNTRLYQFTKKRKNQYYIQTWHSPLRLKKIEMDAPEHLSSYYKKCMKNDSKLIDLIISGCDFSTQIYKNSFLYDGEVLEVGTPRCDIFFNDDKRVRLIEDMVAKYNINKECETILYAPTFRTNTRVEDYMMDINKVRSDLDGKYNILVRSHPNIKIDFSRYHDVIDVSNYPDMQELLVIADILITDYSSCSFDMYIAKKPCFLLVKDLEQYLENERGLYFDFNELPFPINKNEEELVKSINHMDKNVFNKDYAQFSQKIISYENGSASMKVSQRINKILN